MNTCQLEILIAMSERSRKELPVNDQCIMLQNRSQGNLLYIARNLNIQSGKTFPGKETRHSEVLDQYCESSLDVLN